MYPSMFNKGLFKAMMIVRADLTYQQGLHKMWSRKTRYDYYWPSLALLVQ